MRLLLLAPCSLLLATLCPAAPHVVLIMTDDQGYGDLACHGNKHIVTPNLDRLHGESLRLTNFHVNSACAPTRAALMTGRTAMRTGVWHVVMGRTILHNDEITMAELFRKNGYRTAMFGKWHLGDSYPFRPQDQGFEEVLTHGGGVVGHTPDYWMNDYFDDTYLHNGKWEKQKGYCTDVWIDGAIQFLDQNRAKPCFVYLPLTAPHGPFEVPERFEAMYRDNPEVPHAAFYGMITAIDEAVGRLDKALTRLGIRDDTILIFLTDNGTSKGIQYRKGKPALGHTAGMRGKKGSPYDGGHRVPCFIRWPRGGMHGGRDVNHLTAHYDLLPTLMEMCKLQAPKNFTLNGLSLVLPLLDIELEPWPVRTLVTELPLTVEVPKPWVKTAVMTDRWRLVNKTELYDMSADPGQKHNVAKAHPKVMKSLTDWYDRYWKSLAPSRKRTCEIPLGSPEQNPTRLSAYHWNNKDGQQRNMPWAHHHIVAGPLQNGFWHVVVARAGTSAFRLRRWPKESGLKINEHADHLEPPEKPWHPLEPGKLTATRARVRVGDVEKTIPVPAGAEEVELRLVLDHGSARLQTWFIDAEDQSRGAYYVEVERVSE
jgi:arylsulfatase A-like enzyme